jgi:hypothetical protein
MRQESQLHFLRVRGSAPKRKMSKRFIAIANDSQALTWVNLSDVNMLESRKGGGRGNPHLEHKPLKLAQRTGLPLVDSIVCHETSNG